MARSRSGSPSKEGTPLAIRRLVSGWVNGPTSRGLDADAGVVDPNAYRVVQCETGSRFVGSRCCDRLDMVMRQVQRGPWRTSLVLHTDNDVAG